MALFIMGGSGSLLVALAHYASFWVAYGWLTQVISVFRTTVFRNIHEIDHKN